MTTTDVLVGGGGDWSGSVRFVGWFCSQTCLSVGVGGAHLFVLCITGNSVVFRVDPKSEVSLRVTCVLMELLVSVRCVVRFRPRGRESCRRVSAILSHLLLIHYFIALRFRSCVYCLCILMGLVPFATRWTVILAGRINHWVCRFSTIYLYHIRQIVILSNEEWKTIIRNRIRMMAN